MDDLISRKDLEKFLDNICKTIAENSKNYKSMEEFKIRADMVLNILQLSKSIPSAQTKTGYWIKKITKKEPTCEVWHFECSECGEWEYRADFEHGKFCSNCGIKMEGVAE